jgi:hypothetical protein
MKDFCKYKSATGRGAFTRSFGMKWAQECLEKANKIANVLQDSGPARQLVSSSLTSLGFFLGQSSPLEDRDRFDCDFLN